jgi:predicted phage tail protein
LDEGHDRWRTKARNAAIEIDRLRAQVEALKALLNSALYHCESEGDDTLVAMINEALREGQ